MLFVHIIMHVSYKSARTGSCYHACLVCRSLTRPFHPVKTGPRREVLDAAATCIQRHLKGWLLRKKLDDLKRKVRIGDA